MEGDLVKDVVCMMIHPVHSNTKIWAHRFVIHLRTAGYCNGKVIQFFFLLNILSGKNIEPHTSSTDCG